MGFLPDSRKWYYCHMQIIEAQWDQTGPVESIYGYIFVIHFHILTISGANGDTKKT